MKYKPDEQFKNVSPLVKFLKKKEVLRNEFVKAKVHKRFCPYEATSY